jgi:ribose transport system ATP-binding protein
VLVLYDGAVKRVLIGDEITERALISSALNIAIDNEGTGVAPAMSA